MLYNFTFLLSSLFFFFLKIWSEIGIRIIHGPALYMGKYGKWELISQDKRVPQSAIAIFYKLKTLQMKQIQNSACISQRKCKIKGNKYAAGYLKSDNWFLIIALFAIRSL